MKFGHFVKILAPVAALAVAAALSGCDGMKMQINDDEGKPLSEIDTSGPAPTELVLAGPDDVVITHGDKLAITVEGDPAVTEQMRFSLKNGTLGIMRPGKLWKAGSAGKATVKVTMPDPSELVLAGSGTIKAVSMARQAKVMIAGSGEVETQALTVEKLELTVAGSGNYKAGGSAHSLEMNIAGSGAAQMDGLKVDEAKVTIAGSGSAAFASDGSVTASIMGSGNVTVRGRASCKVSSMGSGKLVCEPGDGKGIVNEDADEK